MKFSLLSKFFLSFFISGIILVGLMIGTMRFYTFQNFGTYIDQLALEKLSHLTSLLGAEYQKTGNWQSLRDNHTAWTRIFIESGLLNMTAMVPPDPGSTKPLPTAPMALEKAPHPRQPLPAGAAPPDPFDIGLRLSLFDLNYQLVMGRARTKEDHEFITILVDTEVVGYLGMQNLQSLSAPLDQYFIQRQERIMYLIGGLFLVISLLVSFSLASHLLAPIRKLSQATRLLASRNFDTKIPVHSTDELAQLGHDFNDMTTRLGAYELRQKQWLSDISHELRTPLAILIGEVDALSDGIREPEPKAIESIQAELLHLKRLIDDLHTLSVEETKTLQLSKSPVAIGPLLATTLEKYQATFAVSGIDMTSQLRRSDTDIISGDSDRLIQLFTNLLDNSLRYTDAPGTLHITTLTTDHYIEICFEDSGPGVSDEDLPHLFDRLFRAEPSRNRKTGGSGIGLAICKQIIERHQGTITAEPASAGGLSIQLQVPKEKR